jgi:hypothetical protein
VDETYLARLVEQELRLSTGPARTEGVRKIAARFGVSADTVRGSAALSRAQAQAFNRAIQRSCPKNLRYRPPGVPRKVHQPGGYARTTVTSLEAL